MNLKICLNKSTRLKVKRSDFLFYFLLMKETFSIMSFWMPWKVYYLWIWIYLFFNFKQHLRCYYMLTFIFYKQICPILLTKIKFQINIQIKVSKFLLTPKVKVSNLSFRCSAILSLLRKRQRWVEVGWINFEYFVYERKN